MVAPHGSRRVGGRHDFSRIVLVPAIRQPQFAGVASALIRWTALRFRWVGLGLLWRVLFYRRDEPRRARHWLARTAGRCFLARFFWTHAVRQADRRRRDPCDQCFSRLFSRPARGRRVGVRCEVIGDLAASTSGSAVGPAQSRAGSDRDRSGYNAGPRGAVVEVVACD